MLPDLRTLGATAPVHLQYLVNQFKADGSSFSLVDLSAINDRCQDLLSNGWLHSPLLHEMLSISIDEDEKPLIMIYAFFISRHYCISCSDIRERGRYSVPAKHLSVNLGSAEK